MGIKIVLFQVMLSVLLCGCSDITKPTHPVPVEFLRAEYTKSIIKTMNESQFAGDADATFSGNHELFLVVTKESQKVFPDGQYIAHVGSKSRDVDNGYVFHAGLVWSGWKRQVYKKVENVSKGGKPDVSN